ncbi:hypothetical protein H0A36_20420 [Endozoicomonas sp. SM1973]|uniref:Beta-ketoacyl-[acyl-carrier-protein] synthase III C-terminal domain-containing protein n=1 Tax=Spartinivicinus marinus TaxID=2994442 RepID=A0A853IGW1_9GAMM|nr:3-oxoacyl-[acyl-carrier-protein] synthase III C-terminal domain-containing protein [Spartinivicinus marinus]MCX4028186.1 hypothetical protein [Spartinivicinus marinus]NYZ68385.1 hypothetical protein [Spartinivicinus marinus]
MKVLGLGHVLPQSSRLADVKHPNKMQLEAIRLAGYDKYGIDNTSTRVMGAQAVTKALEASGYSADDVGFIVAGQSSVPDFIGIDLACQIGAELGGLQLKTVNLVEGCGTAISAWITARGLIDTLDDGQVGVVVLAQRVSEPHYDRFGLMNAILSDGAAAAIVGKTNSTSTAECCFVYKSGQDISDTRFVDMMRIERGGGLKPVVLPDHDSRNDQLGREKIMELYRLTGSDLTEFLALRADNTIQIIESCLNEASWSKESNLILLHTLEGRQSIAMLAAKLGIAVDNTNIALVAELGHMGCVDLLISLDMMQKQDVFKPGNRIVMSAISTGMKWGCCLFEYQQY